MSPTQTITYPALTDPQWGIGRVAMLTLSATCLFLVAGCAAKPFVVGLKPEPPFDKKESRVETLRPTFRWERFPGAQDLEEFGPQASERITAVSYELRLWKVGKAFPGTIEKIDWIGAAADDYKYGWQHECRDTDPGELVYSKQGLPTPEHKVETPLEPDSRYFWSVRAHFTLDGTRRATEWSEQFLSWDTKRVTQVPPPGGRFVSGKDGCSYPATFHLIRTP